MSSTPSIEFSAELPSGINLLMFPGDDKLFRLRIAVSRQIPPPLFGYYPGIETFGDGEVEEYWVKMIDSMDDENSVSAASLSMSVSMNNDIMDESSVDGISDSEFDDSSDAEICEFIDGVFDDYKKVAGSHSVHFSGNGDYIALDTNNLVLNKELTARTVSLWLYCEDNSGIQDIYEEGDSSNGFGLRINNGTLELAAENNNSTQIISTNMPVNQWVLVTGVFDNGRLSLYLNDHLDAENPSLGFTSIPARSGDAGLGGSNGTNVFGQTNNNYNGWIDELDIYNKALSIGEIQILAGTGTNYKTTTSKNQKTTDVQDLVVYPNPSKGDFNIITEVKEAGTVKIQIIDLLGKVVYEKSFHQVNAGLQNIAIKEVKLTKATYILKVINKDQIQTEQLIIE